MYIVSTLEKLLTKLNFCRSAYRFPLPVFKLNFSMIGLFIVDGKQEENIKKQIAFLKHTHCIKVLENYSSTQNHS